MPLFRNIFEEEFPAHFLPWEQGNKSSQVSLEIKRCWGQWLKGLQSIHVGNEFYRGCWLQWLLTDVGSGCCKGCKITTVKPRKQEHPLSGFRLIGFLYIGYFR